MVERNLAKVEVGSSSLLSRSIFKLPIMSGIGVETPLYCDVKMEVNGSMNQEKQFSLEQSSGLDELLDEFIKNCPHPANLKDANTGQYILGNQPTVELFGLQTTEQLIGVTVRDIGNMMQARWGKAYTYAEEVADLDQIVKIFRKSAQDKQRVILENNGFVTIQNMIKHPIQGRDNKQVIAILTYGSDVTRNTDLFCLFELYKKFHANKRMAIENFLRYLKINNYFSENLTEAELMILLCMRHNQIRKEIARRLIIQPKTVEVHINNIRGKLGGSHLNTLMEVLRK